LMLGFTGNKVYLAVLFVLLLTLPIGASPQAADDNGGTVSLFDFGAGGRNIALGGAKAAVWGGSYALLWNPAGLDYLERGEINLFHTPLFDESCSYSSILCSYPFIEIGTISFGIQQLSIDGIERRDAGNLVLPGELSNKQTRYVLGFARPVYGGLSSGISLKLDRFELEPYSANGFGMDIGIGFQSGVKSPLVEGIAMGLSFSNVIEPTLKLVEGESGDPRGVRAGVAFWRPVFNGIEDRLLFAIDAEKSRYCETGMHFGCEYLLNDVLAVRGGYDSGFPTFGFGFFLYSIQVDYAFRDTDLESYHLFSVSYGFGPSKTERISRRERLREEEIRREIDKETSKYESSMITSSLEKGRASMDRMQFADAAAYFETVLLWEPENEEARKGKISANAYQLISRADSLFEKGRFAEALLDYRRGNRDLNSPEIEERVEFCERTISESDDRKEMIESMVSRALELYTNRQWQEASKVLRELLDLDPNHDIARSYFVKSESRLKEEYNRILQEIDLTIGKKRYSEAIEAVRIYLERFPGDIALEERLLRATRLREATEVAAGETVETETKEPPLSASEIQSIRSKYEKGVEYFKDGKFELAVSNWEEVWRKHPAFEKVEEFLIKAYQYWGMELYTRHDYNEALKVWSRIIEVDPGNEKAIRYIKRTREEMSRLERVAG